MKMYRSVLAVMLMISLAACSTQSLPSAPTGSTQSSRVVTLDEGVWPVNEYTEGLPVPPGTVVWAALDTEHEYCSVSLTGIDESDYNEYMELLKQEGFSVIEDVSEEIEGTSDVSIGTLLSDEEKWLSICCTPDSIGIYISFDDT